MIVDTSALITILRDEPEALSYAKAIEMAERGAFRQQTLWKRP